MASLGVAAATFALGPAAAAAAPCGGVRDYIYAGTRLLAVAETPLPTLGLNAATASVVERPGATVTVTVLLTTSDGCGTTGAASVHYSTLDGTAQAGAEYVATSGTITFPLNTPSGTTASFSVALLNDTLPEPARTFRVVLSSPSGALFGISVQDITIVDNDTPIVSFVSAASRVSESGAWLSDAARVEVQTNEGNDLEQEVTVNLSYSDGTAVVGSDYLPQPATVSFGAETASGTSVPLDLEIVQDAIIESDETFALRLLPRHGASPGGLTQHTVTIASDDVVSVSGTMVASGEFAVGGTVSYTVVLTNTGPGAQADNPGEDEFVDVLPSALTLRPDGSTASAGVLSANGNRLSWNGTLPSGASVTLTIQASVNPETYSQMVSSQGTIRFDSNASGDNDASAATDDPRVPGPSDPVVFQVGSGPTSFYSVAPCRVIDTRRPDGPLGGPALEAESDRTFAVTGACGIPPSAKSVAINIAVTSATSGGFLSLRAAGTPREPTTAINYGASDTRANNGMVVLNPAGEFTVTCHQAAGTVQFILDVSGYFE